MFGYALRRVASAIPVVLIAITLCFFILRLAPGGPFDGERALPADALKNLRAYYNLDQPLFVQYLLYVGGVFRGDLGPSMVMTDFSVSQLMMIGLPFTLTLGFSAFIIGTAFGLVAGALAALYQNKWPDYVLVFVVLIGLIIPNFLMANLLQLLFGVYLRWLPAGGYVPGSWIHLVLPITILVLPHGGRVARLMRGSMIEVLGTNYVRTARSKGLGTRLILARHAIKPALLPVVSYLGPGLSYLLTGSLVVEQVFALPGIGKYFITAALNRDYGLVLGTTILYMFIILVLNLIVDIVYAWLDPKVRYR
ncbi:ABC transporter permease [Paradevosia shaoguanensis]|jgi:oligopeptide transport system permease protein|uniref:ABC transporter permease subunit n=1 Tax=Paradevosia shaoguanensis TaxID=1335043 RepID=A0AA41UCT3_9HYPH|nr:ABC transporter permease subunit [Paradevosia shaoguanensis]KFL26089.1 oligopeptide transporter permease [Devosia sp. 17-2-E-8]QMV00737.1 ABC transporter permease subunit [Devosia sp. D6-9]CDP52879.1 Oligopeptide transport system permease protein Opp B [Devosia sp. DBB001]MCF1744485.1 ABC transporter permease subunit [Paradevosia shaoguanensis]MCI0128968.1 ABC transporter permease subunit [Paradevosia shaoguanensis]